MIGSHQTLIIFKISCVLAAFQKYYEFKNFIELLPYKKAVEKSKDGFYEMINTYRSELLKRSPGAIGNQKINMQAAAAKNIAKTAKTALNGDLVEGSGEVE